MIRKLKQFIGQRSAIRLAWHYAKAFLAAAKCGFPARKLTVILVTGTDGKTTTVSMIGHILQATGVPTCVASTAAIWLPSGQKENDSHLTSLTPVALQHVLKQAVQEGATHAVVEASSHGLVQGRLDWLWPKVAGFTNVTPESLDYHKTMEQYRKDKGIMFQKLRGKGTKVLNLGDKATELYNKIPTAETKIYGTEEADMWLTDIKASSTGVSALLHYAADTVNLTLSIPGLFNLENAQCALLCAEAVGVKIADGAAALKTFEPVPGRMQRIDVGQPFHVFVDFTVTPASYKSTLESLRAMVEPGKRVLVMCSSCGNRMPEKRPLVGKVCSQLADIVVVTEDETYGEDPMKVLEEVWAGVEQDQTEAHKITDRKEAIAFLLKQAAPGDAVIFCGMGPFTSFKRLEGDVPWNEVEIVKSML